MKLFLIDQYSIIFKSYYALKSHPITYNGQNLSAVYGFFKTLLSILKDKSITHLVVCGDMACSKSIRKAIYPQYKANRESAPDELVHQFDIIDEFLIKSNIKVIKAEGYEADDVIASLCKNFFDTEIVIYSLDKDFNQLVSKNITILKPGKKENEKVVVDESFILEEFGFYPSSFIDYQSLLGDAIDNIPGVYGVGKVSAKKLIKEWQSIENLYENINLLQNKKLKEHIIKGKANAFLSKKLARLIDDISNVKSFQIDDFLTKELNANALVDCFKTYKFNSLINTLQKSDIPKSQLEIFDQEEQKPYLTCKIDENFFSYKLNFLFEDDNKFFLSKLDDNFNLVKVYDINNLESIELIKLKSLLKKQKLVTFDAKSCFNFFEKIQVLPNLYFDISIAAYLLDTEMRNYNYENLINQYIIKEEDFATNLVSLFKILISEIEKKDLKGVMILELRLLPVLVSMQNNGILVNKDKLQSYFYKIQEQISELEGKIFLLNGGQKFNILSTKQLQNLLFEKRGLSSYRKNKTGFSVDFGTLEKLKDKDEIVPLILEYRHLNKLKSTYIEPIQKFLKKDLKIHTTFLHTNTATGRLASENPNMQNIPRGTDDEFKIRDFFIPSPGYIFVSFDYSQIELLILAYYSKDENLVSSFLQNIDSHKITASKIFNIPYDKVDKRQREISKAINYGIIYGLSSFGLKNQLKISKDESQKYIDSYYKTHPKIKEFIQSIIEKAKKTQQTRTLLNRYRKMKDSNYSYLQRIAPNSVVQGTASDIIKLAMINIDSELHHFDAKMLLQIHDELVFEVAKTQVRNFSIMVKSQMENVLDLNPLKLKVSISKGFSLYELK